MFIGSGSVFAAIGSDSFRQDSHIAYNQAASIGEQIWSLSEVGDFVSTIGIVDDESNGVGRYFFMRYSNPGGTATPVAVSVYDSPFIDEVGPSSVVSDSWLPLVPLNSFVEQSMRVVNDGVNGTYLFYLAPTVEGNSQLNVVRLPDPGDPA